MVARLLKALTLASLIVLPALGAPGPGPQTQAQVHLGRPSATGLEPSGLRQRYDGDQVSRINWEKVDASTKTHIMELVEHLDLDIWRSSSTSLDLRLSPHELPVLRSHLPSSADAEVFIPSLQPLIDATYPSHPFRSDAWNVSSLDSSFYDHFHTVEELYAFGDELAVQFPGVVEGFDVGQTFEGREIRGWRAHLADNSSLSGGEGGDERKAKKGRKGEVQEKPILEFVVQSGQHAREWIGPMTAMYFLHSLVLAATSEPSGDIAQLLRSFTFAVVPLINPDGFVYSQQYSRLWRKNRQPIDSPKCLGVDLNSNWGYKWRASRSNTACSDSYQGRDAFEAYETRAMANYLANGTSFCRDCTDQQVADKPRRKVRAFVDLHSYGQLFMFPFAHSCADFPPDAEMLMEAGLGVAKAMRNHGGQDFQAGQACDMTYRAPGDAIDFAYGVIDARWSFSAELRDTGTYGFLLPPHLIRPTAEETAAGLTYLAKFIYNAEILG